MKPFFYPNFLLALCGVCAVLLQVACSKSSDTISSTPPKIEILTGNKWKVQVLYFREKGEPVSANIVAGYFTFKPCEVDDINIFNRNNRVSRLDSIISCDPLDRSVFTSTLFGPQNNGLWSVDSAFTKMEISDIPSYALKWEIKTLTNKLFEAEMEKTDLFGDKGIYTYRFIPAP